MVLTGPRLDFVESTRVSLEVDHNATPELLPEAGAQRTLHAIACRPVFGEEAAGKRYGTAGTKIGNAHLTWAFSEAAVRLLRANPTGQKYLTTLEKKHGSGNALTLLGQKLGRTVYDMLQRQTAFDMGKFLNG